MVVAREGPDGVEVLVLERSGNSRFAPGFVVFPGGALEPGDEDLAVRWFGSPEHAARACAVRELYEEAGMLVTAGGVVTASAGQPRIEELAFAPPDPEALPEMSRWIAPEFIPRRFDARFFAVAAPSGVEPTPDGVEIERAWWARAGQVMARAAAGEVPLMWPTLKTLESLRECATVQEVLALRVPQVEPPLGRLGPVRPPDGGPVAWREPGP